MNPINVNPSDLCNNCNIAGFTPAVHYAFSKGGNTVTIYDHSTFPAGDGLKINKVKVSDKFGNSVQGSTTITGSGHTAVLSTSTLNLTKGFDITATVITNNGLVADGDLHDISSAADGSGEVDNWDAQIAPAQ